MTPVSVKAHNYRLWQSGAYGNKLRAWESVREWRASGYAGRVTIRVLARSGGGCLYSLQSHEVEQAVEDLVAAGTERSSVMLNEAMPYESVVLQGEYDGRVSGGLEGSVVSPVFYCSRDQAHMRPALAGRGARHLTGLMARLAIREAMTPASHEDWLELVERYPGHVLEVSIFEHYVGDLPHRNAVVWEVRAY